MEQDRTKSERIFKTIFIPFAVFAWVYFGTHVLIAIFN
jgi:hypothetical protein